jgi:transcription-repair coupling factor (superfamily II helicase)
MAAIDDVMAIWPPGRPMDRLVVGDVGFGKTEVAMRAAFVAASRGKQVAVVAPTTLLARQHFRTFAERFRAPPINVRPLSRFVSAKDAAETRKGLADGTVDIVVGTHAVLAKAVKFKNLGLLIIDEEQHFGVGHKERLKEAAQRRPRPDLTATPIPRTLQLSLTGVRDLSIIGTPPVDRLAIRTYVSEFDSVTIREALLREKYRGGQSFFVVPRIADLPEKSRTGCANTSPRSAISSPMASCGGRSGSADERLLRRQAMTCCWRPPSWKAGSIFRPPTR